MGQFTTTENPPERTQKSAVSLCESENSFIAGTIYGSYPNVKCGLSQLVLPARARATNRAPFSDLHS